MNYSAIQWKNDDGVSRLTLNPPDKIDAFQVEMCGELIDAHRGGVG